ncbi:DUF4340 domain-containing protein [Paludisphaera sp.]|uniref:DUF4340 domain-containing protein n=1 Tax=Paludisphaera sp. TaxID=2017432 RepID=UPI00301E4A91
MRRARSTYVLAAAFLAALLALWGLERAGVLTEAERLRRRDRVLPELIDLDPADVRKVELARGDERLTFERRGPRRWTIAEAGGVDASAEEVARLVGTIRGLRKSPEAGVLDGGPSSFGLAPPAAVARLWTDPDAPPVATLEVGREIGQERFVRPGPDGPVAVVPARALADVDRPAVDWRETSPVPPWTFPISAISIHRDGLDAKAERGRRGEWRLTSPVGFPADGARIDRLCEALADLRVAPDAGGFVADRPEDYAPFGLAPPAATVELKPAAPGSGPLTLMIGSSPPDRPDQVYIRLGGRDDVMAVDGRFVRRLPEALKDLRDYRLAEFDPSAVVRVEIDAPGGPFHLERDAGGWSLTSPVASRTDQDQVEALLKAANDLYALDFQEPGTVGAPGVDPPALRLRIWRDGGDSGASDAAPELALSLAIGRHDALRKVVFAQVEGDDAIIALPDLFVSALPKSRHAFRDTALPTPQPTAVTRLTIVRPGRTTVLEPADPSGAPNRWKMTRPVEADADLAAVTSALARLAELRASSFVADADGDLTRFGLTSPLLEVLWEGRTPGSLLVGSATADDPSRHYAVLADFPAVFTLQAEALAPLAAEFHDTRVLSFRPEAVRRLVLQSETRRLAYRHRARPEGGPADWIAEAGTPTGGVDLSRFDSLTRALSELRAIRFIQYAGPFPPGSGLLHPRLTIVAEIDGRDEPVRLILGSKFLSDWVCAATSEGSEGAAFLLHGAAWEGLILDVEGGLPPIPDDPFAPPDTP